jgi:exosortase A-associated hydrolase 2
MNRAPRAFFLPVDGTRLASAQDQRFCIHHPAQGGTFRGQVIYVHPFAEEMNKARRTAALQSRALAAAGFSVLQIDLTGCGDSSGDFGDATWQGWIDDILLARQWLLKQDAVAAPLWLWGLRAGCLLAAEAGPALDETVNYCFWQPATNGKLLLQQFLRLRVAAEMMNGASKGLMDELRGQLASGKTIEVAGYALAPALAHGLEHARLAPAIDKPGRVEWFELSTREDAALTPVSTQALAQWSTAGFQCGSTLVRGPAFWQTTEIEDAPALLDATLAALLTCEEVVAA